MQRIRKLALVATAALALTVVAATPASAAPDVFAADSYTASLSGSGEQVLTTQLAAVTCESTLTGELKAPTAVLATSLAGTCWGTGQAIQMNGCKIELNPQWDSFAIGPKGCGPVKLSIGMCQFHFPPQSGLSATYSTFTEGGVRKVLVTANETHLRYTSPQGYCSEPGDEGALKGSWVLSAGKANGVYVEAHYEDSLFAAETYTATLAGQQEKGAEHSIGMESGALVCSGVTVAGSLASASESVSLTPTYTGCKYGTFATSTIAMNGCSYTYWVGEGEGYPQDISCPKGSSITVSAGTCKMSIPAQSGLTAVDYALSTSPDTDRSTISIESNVSGLTYTVTQDGFLCPFKGTGTRTNGTYTGGTFLEGRDAEGFPLNIGIGA